MKTVLLCSILFCVIAMPALGELTEADLNKIRLIVNEELKPIEADIVILKTDTAWIRGKLESVDDQFEGVNNQITHARNLTYGLIALIVVAVGIPQIIMAWRSKKDSTQEQQIKELKQDLEELKQRPEPLFTRGSGI